jgi:hypothetical protein
MVAEAAAPVAMGRYREYADNTDRQRAYRQRKAAEEARLREKLRQTSTKAATRKLVSAKLVKVLGMLGSDYAGERDNAARAATKILKDAKLTWYDVFDIAEEPGDFFGIKK